MAKLWQHKSFKIKTAWILPKNLLYLLHVKDNDYYEMVEWRNGSRNGLKIRCS